jgi:hypothetical protein
MPTNSPPRVLILDETVAGAGTNSPEAIAAQLAIPGCAVDVASQTNWSLIPATGTGGPTGFGFDQYRAIIIGDDYCNAWNPGYIAAMNVLNATQPAWAPACSGNVIIMGVDNAGHALSLVGADKTIKRGVAFAVNDPSKTGFYYAMSCFYDFSVTGTTNAQLVPHLTGFGNFMVRSYLQPPQPPACLDNVHIVATHPIFTNAPALTDAELSNWSCSTHEGFTAWPPNFVVLAIAMTPGAYTATDGSNGIPYMLVRGEGVKVLSSIDLGPQQATNVIGTSHTFCATLATNVVPRANVAVTFTIVSGPNAVTNFTTLTDSNGVACFTYYGNGGLGTDYVTASYMDGLDKVHTSGTVTKLWVSGCVGVGCPLLDCLSDGTWTCQLCVTNLNANPLTALSLFNAPAGVTFTPNPFPLAPALGVAQATNLTVTLSGPVTLSNLCFTVGSFTTNAGVMDCSIPVCLVVPACCNRVTTNTLTYVGTTGLTSFYNYSVTIQNVTGQPIQFVGFGADQPCVNFVPSLVDLTLPAYGTNLLMPTQTRTLNLQVQRTAPCPGTNTFHLSTCGTNPADCCSTKLMLPPARCLYLDSPYYGSVMLTSTPFLLRAVPFSLANPCSLRWVKFYSGATLLGDAAINPGTGGFELVVSNLPPGLHQLVAVGLEESSLPDGGELETTDPVEITVLAPGTAPDDHPGPTLSAGVSGASVVINLPTATGHQYEVQYCTDLVLGAWTTLQTTNGNGAVITFTDMVTNAAARFYRAVVSH